MIDHCSKKGYSKACGQMLLILYTTHNQIMSFINIHEGGLIYFMQPSLPMKSPA